MPHPQDQNRASANLAKVNANAVCAALIVGAVLNLIMGAMLPRWIAASNQSMASWLSIAFYVSAPLAIGLGFYLRAAIRKAQNSTSSNIIQRNERSALSR